MHDVSDWYHYIIMIRTQISLTESQAADLQRIAAERGVSMAALVREGVDYVLRSHDDAGTRRRAVVAIGSFRSGDADVSERHDDYLDGALSP